MNRDDLMLPDDGAKSRAIRDSRHHHYGFTLVELLVCIAVIAILLGLTAGGLSSIRGHAGLTRDLSTIRQIGMSIDMYASSQQDLYPITEHSPWINSVRWAPALKALGLVEDARRDAHIGPPNSGDLPDAVMSVCMCYSPSLMQPGHTIPPDESRVSPVHHADVANPSAKGLLYDGDIEIPSGTSTDLPGATSVPWCTRTIIPGPVYFADGSAEIKTWPECLPSGVLSLDDRVGQPVFSTWGGYRGRDR